MEKLKQLDDLIKEKKQDQEERRRQIDRKKIADENEHWWMKQFKENVRTYENLIKETKNQTHALLQ